LFFSWNEYLSSVLQPACTEVLSCEPFPYPTPYTVRSQNMKTKATTNFSPQVLHQKVNDFQ
jgi:hypothetical protein